MTAERRLLELLREFAYIEKEVVLASGEKSDFYIDCRQVSLMPEGMLLIGGLLYNAVRCNAPDAVSVGGPSIGADPLVCSTVYFAYGLRPRLNGFLVRKEPKKHGLSKWLEGPALEKGSPVVLVEDVVTSGGSLLKAMNVVREEGLNVQHLITLINRSDKAEIDGVPLTSLYTMKDFK